MAGKILKVSSNDLYGNVDDRIVTLYACFQHKKYMNNYAIFSFDGDNNKLSYGSVHLKKDSLVVFNVKPNIKKYIEQFINEYIEDNLNDYKILEVENIKKIELVSYNDMELDNLQIQRLEDKSIVKEVQREEIVKEKKPIFLYVLLLALILLGGGLTLLYFMPELFTVKYKSLLCTNTVYDENIELNYKIDKEIKFDNKEKVDIISVVRTYSFLDSASYDRFKNNNTQNQYFTNGERYKYIDESLVFKLFYEDKSVIDDYDEMLAYLKKEGYSCIEQEYEK